MDFTVAADRRSWVSVDAGSDFPLQNIPFGIGVIKGHSAVVSIIGSSVIDLNAMAAQGLLDDAINTFAIDRSVFAAPALNPFMALGKAATRAVRLRIAALLDEAYDAGDERAKMAACLLPQHEVSMKMPVQVGDYTDFYSSKEHATNVGIMFRGKENALMPNWLHIPIGYHGRAGSIVVSGTSIRRPKGQMKPPTAEHPLFGPTKQLDFELEMAFVLGKNTNLGDSVAVEAAEDYIFGMLLFNDWSARDIQAWEYQPLGPFLGKNFGSTVSPWVVTLDALEPFRLAGPVQEPLPLPYLQQQSAHHFDIGLAVDLITAQGAVTTICESNHKYLYWSMAQQLAHHTVNGCNVRVGDLMASGTISGPDSTSFGSMLELSWRGERPVRLVDGQTRTFIQDGDTIRLRAWSERDGLRLGFGEASGRVLPAI